MYPHILFECACSLSVCSSRSRAPHPPLLGVFGVDANSCAVQYAAPRRTNTVTHTYRMTYLVCAICHSACTVIPTVARSPRVSHSMRPTRGRHDPEPILSSCESIGPRENIDEILLDEALIERTTRRGLGRTRRETPRCLSIAVAQISEHRFLPSMRSISLYFRQRRFFFAGSHIYI